MKSNQMNACRSYVFVSRKTPSQESPGTPLALVENALIANEICKLFRKHYPDAATLIFHHLPLSTFDLGDQVLFDEISQTLDLYSDPDRFLYDPPPDRELHCDAQYAKQATEWATILRDKLSKLSDAERIALGGTYVVDRYPNVEQEDTKSSAYLAFTTPDSLKRLGTPVVLNWIGAYLSELRNNGLLVPSENSPDFFIKVSEMLRDENQLPKGIKTRILEFIEKSRMLAAEYQSNIEKEFQANHVIVPLLRKETGKPLLLLLDSVDGMVPDYPENMTEDDAKQVGLLLDDLRDYADIYDKLEPSETLQFERMVSKRMQDLKQRGLALFAGQYAKVITHEDGTSTRSPIAVVMVASCIDPRIRRSVDGEALIQGAIPKRKVTPNNNTTTTEPNAAVNTAKTATAIPKPTPVQNLFQRSGSVWRIIFNGPPEFHVPNTLGARYLDYLLHNPGQSIVARDLEVMITPEKATTRSNTSTQLASDPEAVRSYLKEMDKLRAERGDAVDQGRLSEVERIDEELTHLETTLKSFQVGTNAGERARGNVSKAIATVESSLLEGERHQRAFGEHLKECVSKGYTLRYAHPKGDVWQ